MTNHNEERAAFEAWYNAQDFSGSCWEAWKQARTTAAEGWRPIESAPKDADILTYTAALDRPIRICPTGLAYTHSEATHWMPLPAAPGRNV